MTLTERQQSILDFIQGHIASHGYSPTLREIADEFDIKSPHGVLCHLRTLERKGFILREPKAARAIQVVDRPETSPIADAHAVLDAAGIPSAECNGECNSALGHRLKHLLEGRQYAESALVRARRGWRNAMELGILNERYHEEAKSIVEEITVALAKMGSEKTLG